LQVLVQNATRIKGLRHADANTDRMGNLSWLKLSDVIFWILPA